MAKGVFEPFVDASGFEDGAAGECGGEECALGLEAGSLDALAGFVGELAIAVASGMVGSAGQFSLGSMSTSIKTNSGRGSVGLDI
ncbi:hypothetical protein [Parafrankia sp. FMc2]|uniref:hypothetical protein n=1 Tax=Parafrankia sp. FMc2 TaxID=3233196 RepID=UPI0034D6B536